jgi:hypothetical protein
MKEVSGECLMTFKPRLHISIVTSLLLTLLTGFLVAPSANANGYSVGENGPGGGKVFLIPDSTGNTTGRYFEASLTPIEAGWMCNLASLPFVAPTGIGYGSSNTYLYQSTPECIQSSPYLPYKFLTYTNGGYSDWFIPSINETFAMDTSGIAFFDPALQYFTSSTVALLGLNLSTSFRHGYSISFYEPKDLIAKVLAVRQFIPGSLGKLCSGYNYFVSDVGGIATRGEFCAGTLVLDPSVVAVGTGAFTSGASLLDGALRSVTIPNSVTSIGDTAFFDSPLTSLTLGNSIRTIGDSTFASALVTSLTLPNSLTTIGSDAFYSAPLTSLTIPNLVEDIGVCAFCGAPLTSLTLGSSVKSIGTYAFDSALLTSLTIPASVTTVGEQAFQSASLTCLTNLSSVSTADLVTAGITNAASLQTCEAVEAARLAAIAATAEAARLAAIAATAEAARLAAIAAAVETARIAAANSAADAAKKQKELTEILSMIPSIAGLALNVGDLANTILTKQKCAKGKKIKYVKKGSRCPAGYVKKK